MSISRSAAWMLSLGVMIFGSGVVPGQNYPNKAIRIVTGGAGGGSDFASRVIAQGTAGPLGQPVVVDNQRSAPISLEVGAKMPPDGYNLLVVGEGLWLLPLLQVNVNYDALRDFSPVSLLVTEINIVAVHPSLPVRTVNELIALARARPGELNYASGTPGGGPHLAAELLKSMAGVNITRIPYK